MVRKGEARFAQAHSARNICTISSSNTAPERTACASCISSRQQVRCALAIAALSIAPPAFVFISMRPRFAPSGWKSYPKNTPRAPLVPLLAMSGALASTSSRYAGNPMTDSRARTTSSILSVWVREMNTGRAENRNGHRSSISLKSMSSCSSHDNADFNAALSRLLQKHELLSCSAFNLLGSKLLTWLSVTISEFCMCSLFLVRTRRDPSAGRHRASSYAESIRNYGGGAKTDGECSGHRQRQLSSEGIWRSCGQRHSPSAENEGTGKRLQHNFAPRRRRKVCGAVQGVSADCGFDFGASIFLIEEP